MEERIKRNSNEAIDTKRNTTDTAPEPDCLGQMLAWGVPLGTINDMTERGIPLQEIYRTVGSDYYDVVIVPNIAESVKVVTARYTAENLVGRRDDLARAIESELSTSLDGYNIELVGTAIENMDFTDAFTNAVEAKQVAAQNKLQAQIEQDQKTMEQEQQAKRSVIDANAAADVAKIQAEAELQVAKVQADAKAYAGQKEAEKNKAIAASLTTDLVNYYYVQQWDGKLPESYVGSENPSTIVAIK